MSCVMNLELDINSRPSTLHNQMALLRGRIEHSLIWQGLCLVNIIWVIFLVKAINTACYCSNRLYCHRLKEKTPYELLNGRKPNIAYFRVFICKCYILRKCTRLDKFDKKCDEGFLLGYSTTSKAYRVWNLDCGNLEEVHDVEFDKTKGSQEENENLQDVRRI